MALAAVLVLQSGREGIEAEWEKSDEFHERWLKKARDVLARTEWRKRKLGKRVRAARGAGCGGGGAAKGDVGSTGVGEAEPVCTVHNEHPFAVSLAWAARRLRRRCSRGAAPLVALWTEPGRRALLARCGFGVA